MIRLSHWCPEIMATPAKFVNSFQIICKILIINLILNVLHQCAHQVPTNKVHANKAENKMSYGWLTTHIVIYSSLSTLQCNMFTDELLFALMLSYSSQNRGCMHDVWRPCLLSKNVQTLTTVWISAQQHTNKKVMLKVMSGSWSGKSFISILIHYPSHFSPTSFQ